MDWWPKRIALTIGLALLLVAQSASAMAANSSVRDPHDAKANVDIRSLSASSGKRLSFTFKVQGLGTTGVFIAHWHGLESPGNPESASEQMVVVDHRSGSSRVTIWWAIEIWTRDSCKGMRSAWLPAHDQVRVSLPKRCLYYKNQRLRVDGHSAKKFPYGGERYTDNFPANKPDHTAHFKLAVN